MAQREGKITNKNFESQKQRKKAKAKTATKGAKYTDP